MIWKSISRDFGKFQPHLLEETTEQLMNPGRGWYRIYTFDLEKRVDLEEVRWSLYQGETLALILLDLGGFWNRVLNDEALRRIEKILEFFADQNRDVILRPVYDREGKGREREPEEFSLVLTHLRQIGQILREKKHTVFLFQGLLVGSWGEMHGSRFLEKEQMREMWNTLSEYLGTEIYGAVRTPAQWRTLVSESEYQKEYFLNLSVFDDGMFGSTTHLGTFGTMTREAAGWEQPWNRQEELHFLKVLNQRLPFGGEAIAEETPIISQEKLLKEMKSLQPSYLNCVHDIRILEQWKQQSVECTDLWKGHSLYDYIGAHLGYRFVVEKAEVTWRRFQKLQISITLTNRGFGSLLQGADLVLIIENEKQRKEYLIPCNVEQWQGGNTGIVETVIDFMEGNLFLELRRRRDKRPIQFANKNKTDSLYLGCLYNQ